MVGQVTGFPKARNSGDYDGHKRAKAPKIKVASAPGRPYKIDMEPIEAVRLLSTFGTADLGFASLMLGGLINACCSKVLESGDVNDALAAVSGIGARDEIEGMLATQMVATHFSCACRFATAQGLRERCSAGQQRQFSGQAIEDVYGAG